MNCIEFESTLNELLDQRVDPHSDSSLRAHACECAECERTMEYYSAFADLGKPVDLQTAASSQPKPQVYFAIAAAAAVLLFLLSPLANIGNQNNGNAVNLAKASPEARANSESISSSKSGSVSRIDNEFWKNQRLTNMKLMENFAFRVPETPNLEKVGQSINSVWKSIQEDEFLLPIIQQSALLWMQ